MPDEDVQLPLSGNVTQTFFPLTINLGRSASQATEKDVLTVASYGRQLGRIEDALIVLLKHIKLEALLPEEEKVIRDLKCMLHAIADKKEQNRHELLRSKAAVVNVMVKRRDVDHVRYG